MKIQMKIQQTIALVLLVFGFTLGPAHVARAVPTLQLDILGGFYVGPPEETIFTADSVFTLYAYFWGNGAAPSGPYYISAALTSSGGGITPPGLDRGSFEVAFDQSGDGADDVFHAVDVTDDMTHGTPQIADTDLPSHGIYDTYFYEIPFEFREENLADAYDTEETTGLGPTDNDVTGEMYYQAFHVNIRDFISGPPEHYYRLHFDLYGTETTCTKSKNDPKCTTHAAFAPNSHDAEDPPPPDEVPEPASVLLTGMGMLGLAAFLKKRRSGR